MAKVRGKNYPAISLAEAILRIKAIYEQERDRAVNEQTIAKALSCCGTHTAFVSTISALTKYGLLESVAPSLFKVSENAENIILLTRGHPDRVRALRNIAFTPYLFSKLRESFTEELPSDNILRSFLVKIGFNPNSMDAVIRAYRETLEFVNEEALALGVMNDDDRLSQRLTLTQSPGEINSNVVYPFASPSLLEQTLLYRISEDCTVQIQFNGPATQEAIKKLIALLEVNTDVFPKKYCASA